MEAHRIGVLGRRGTGVDGGREREDVAWKR